MRFSAKTTATLIFCLGLVAWVYFLRSPYFGRPAWNLDEGIHAAIARSILDGGVMYRDAIDQRTPLTYYVVAGIFRVFGENNMWAVHAFLAGMVAATAFGVFLLGRRWRNDSAGVWAALIFCAFSTNLLYIGDTHSLSTEWFVIFFTTWSAWWFWRTWEKRSFWLSGIGGLGFAAAFLSKQPALLDFWAPLATVVLLGWTGRLKPLEATRQLAGLCTGFVALTALVMTYFWAKGALDEFYFYAWSYNLLYYGPETTFSDRMASALEGVKMIWEHYPLIAAVAVAGGLAQINRLGQRRPTEEERSLNISSFYLLSWGLLGWIAAASTGRTYGHYYLQFLPAVALLAGWLLADCQTILTAGSNRLLKVCLVVILAATACNVIAGSLRGPWPANLPPEAGTEAATFIREHSKPSDRLFVWGYSPDFYLLADRKSASRYVYCSFLTGLVPWTNIQPGRDTSYAIVPGTMDILLNELETNRPEYFVDTSLAEYRHFTKYPLAKFPRLAAWVSAHYLEIEATRFPPQGFRVLQLKDSARRTTLALKGGNIAGELAEPGLFGPATTDRVATAYRAQGSHSGGGLQRLQLLIDDQPGESISFEPTKSLSVTFLVPFDQLSRGKHQLRVQATSSNGDTRTSPAMTVDCAPDSLPAEQNAAFALPLQGMGPAPARIVAPYGAAAEQEAGSLVFFTHAPSTLSYPAPVGSTRLRGRFGFRPGAYAPTNPGPTDGAEFVITWIKADGQRTELLRRLLRPVDVPGDRGEQPFDLALPSAGTSATLELAINNGPAGSATSDWTYWSDLMLNTDRRPGDPRP